jgi:hypothetical protein
LVNLSVKKIRKSIPVIPILFLLFI